MNHHDAIHKLAKAWKHLHAARELIDSASAADHINMACLLIMDVGDKKFGREFIDSLKDVYVDL